MVFDDLFRAFSGELSPDSCCGGSDSFLNDGVASFEVGPGALSNLTGFCADAPGASDSCEFLWLY